MDFTQGIKTVQVSVEIRYIVLNFYFIILKLVLDVNKCKGQGYNRSDVMSGINSGVGTYKKEFEI